MTALVWPPISLGGATSSRPWRRCAALSLATATLVVAVVLVALALGWSWPDAGAVGVGGVGTWTLATATTGLRQVFSRMPGELPALAQVAPGLGLGLNVTAVALAQALGGPALMVLGCVDVVVANLVVGTAAALDSRQWCELPARRVGEAHGTTTVVVCFASGLAGKDRTGRR